MHATCRKLDDIPSDQFIELAGPADQSKSVTRFLVRDGHGLDCFRPKSLTTRKWTGIQKWSCRHAAVPPRYWSQAAISKTKRLGIFWEFLGFYCERERKQNLRDGFYRRGPTYPSCK